MSFEEFKAAQEATQPKGAFEAFEAFKAAHKPQATKLAREMSHPVKPEALPPGSSNPLVHFGKSLTDIRDGVRQFLPTRFGLTHALPDFLHGSTPAEQAKTQSDIDTYNKYDHPLWSQIAGDAMYAIPAVASAPVTITGVGTVLGSNALKNLGKALGAKQGASLFSAPVVGGAIEGAAYGGVQFVDPNDPSPAKTRMSRAALGAGMGGVLDAAGYVGKSALARKVAERERAKLSSDLPKPVRLPTGELWAQGDIAQKAHRLRNQLTDNTVDPVTARRFAQSAKAKAVNDITDNANIIRETNTGTAAPQPKGAALTRMADDLQTKRKIIQEEVNDFYDKFDPDRVKAIGSTESLDNAVGSFNDYVRRKRLPTRGGHAKRADTIMNNVIRATNHDSGFINVGKVIGAKKELENLYKGVSPESAEIVQQAKTTLDKWLKDNIDEFQDLPGHNSVAEVRKYNDIANKLDQFKGNRIIDDLSSGNKSQEEVANSIFGKTEGKATNVRTEAVDQLTRMHPEYKTALKRESYQQLYSKPDGDAFDRKAFANNYGRAMRSGQGKDVLDTLLTNKEKKQLGNLYDVTERMLKPKLADERLVNTGPWTEFITTDMSPSRPLPDLLNIARTAEMARNQSGKRYATTRTKSSGPIGGLMGADLNDSDFIQSRLEEERRLKALMN